VLSLLNRVPSGKRQRVVRAGLVGLVIVTIGALIAIVGAAMQVKPDSAGATTIFYTVQVPYTPATTTPTYTPPQVTANAPAPVGRWTAQRGVDIARRAVKWINWPYSFGAGNANGPTYGVPVDADSRYDGHIKGFDCSGLVIYALAPWLNVSHDASRQYEEAGSIHPPLNQLQPGDLVFWSSNGTIGGIGHVAVYIGNGDVIEAPHSGDFVKVARIDQVEAGRIGTTRPLT